MHAVIRIVLFPSHKAAIPAAEAKKEKTMRLMTIFQLAVLTDQEIRAIARNAQEQADNVTLPAPLRDAAAQTLTNIVRLLPAPKP